MIGTDRTKLELIARIVLSALISAGLLAALVVGVAWLLSRNTADAPAPEPGQQVVSFDLPDVVTGQTVSLADFVGKQEVVIVSYMGFF